VTGGDDPPPVTATRVVAVCVLLGAAVVGLARLPGELSAQADAAAASRSIPRFESVAVPSSLGRREAEFLAYVRRTVPPADSVRIVQGTTPASLLETRRDGTPGVCGYSASRLQYFWLVWALSPRPSTCDPDARWTVYYGVEPGPLPAAATVHRFADGYALVRR
jgi:hypothetical protein